MSLADCPSLANTWPCNLKLGDLFWSYQGMRKPKGNNMDSVTGEAMTFGYSSQAGQMTAEVTLGL